MLEECRKDFNAKSLITKLRYNEDLRNELVQKTSFLPDNVTTSERMYYWYNNINTLIVCPHCGKKPPFSKFTYGYYPTCGSKECRAKSVAYGNKYSHDYVAIQKKMRETYAATHDGIEHNMQDPEFLKAYIANKKENTVKRYLDNNDYSIIEKNGEFYDIRCNKCRRVYKNIYGDLITYNLYRSKHFCEDCYTNKKSYTVRSKFEDSVYQYVLSLCKKQEKIIPNRKVGKDFYIYDIVLYERNLVIECNGIYYHSELCTLDKEYHYKKMKNANEGGYDLLTIWQDDWYNI